MILTEDYLDDDEDDRRIDDDEVLYETVCPRCGGEKFSFDARCDDCLVGAEEIDVDNFDGSGYNKSLSRKRR